MASWAGHCPECGEDNLDHCRRCHSCQTVGSLIETLCRSCDNAYDFPGKR